MYQIYLFKELINGRNDNRKWERTLSNKLLCRFAKCWSINFSARKDFLQKPQRHSFTSKWILCCSCSRNMSFSGRSLHLLGSSYFSFSTKGIKYCIKRECLTSNVIMDAPMQWPVSNHIACPTSSTAFQAARLRSLEQCTSCVCDFVWWRILASSRNIQLFSIVSQDSA